MVSERGRQYVQLHKHRPWHGGHFELKNCVPLWGRRLLDREAQCNPWHLDDLDRMGSHQVPIQMFDCSTHGGGFVAGCSDYYWLGGRLAAAGCAIHLINYRLAPEHPFPAAIEDAVVYEWLTNHGPEETAAAQSTFIAGDSAGGGLTLASLRAMTGSARPAAVLRIGFHRYDAHGRESAD